MLSARLSEALPPIATTTVGSFHRPDWLVHHKRVDVTFRLDGDLLREALDDATVVLLHEQEQAGLDLLTDGEQRRTNFINHVLEHWDGIDVTSLRPKAIRGRTLERMVPRVVGAIKRRSPAVVDDLRFAKAHTALPIKMAVPGPMTVVDTTCDEAYGDEAALAMDVAVAINAELLELQAAGCSLIQIDEPAMTRHQDKVAQYGLRALDRCLLGVHVPTVVHLCYGYSGPAPRQYQYSYPPLLEMLRDTKISGFSLEFARSGYDPALLRGCGDRLVMFGCVDPGNEPPEPLALVLERARAALEHVDPRRLLLAPDCGLVTASRELGRQKTALLTRAAHELRREL